MVLLHLFGPYGGPLFVWRYLERGFYTVELFTTSIEYPSYAIVVFLNKLAALVFWLCILIPLIIIFTKLSQKMKYGLIKVCMAVAIMIVFIPKILKLF